MAHTKRESGGKRRAHAPTGARGVASDRGGRLATGPAAVLKSHLDDIYRQLDVQMKRMSQIQQQLDLLTSKIDKPGNS